MLDLSQILAYSTALGIAAAIPGPGITALVARSISTGGKSGFAMLGGLICGDLVYLSFAVFGLALIAQSFAALFILIKWGSIAYLCYLAWQFWHAEHQSLETRETTRRTDLLASCLSGLTLTLGNPKTIAFYLALLPVVIDLKTVTVQSWAFMLVPLTVVILLLVGGAFILAATTVRRSLSGVRAQQLIHRGAAGAMLAAAGTMAVRNG